MYEMTEPVQEPKVGVYMINESTDLCGIYGESEQTNNAEVEDTNGAE